MIFLRSFIERNWQLTHPFLFALSVILGFGLYFVSVKAGPPPGVTCTFTGAAVAVDPTNWNVPENWSCLGAVTFAAVPTIDDAVIIPDKTKVIVNTPGGEAFSLQVGLDGVVTVNSGMLIIAEATTNNGDILASPTSEIHFGENFSDSFTTLNDNGKEFPSNTKIYTGGGTIVFFNHFVNKGGRLDATKDGLIAFQRDWIHQKNGYYFGNSDWPYEPPRAYARGFYIRTQASLVRRPHVLGAQCIV